MSGWRSGREGMERGGGVGGGGERGVGGEEARRGGGGKTLHQLNTKEKKTSKFLIWQSEQVARWWGVES